MLTSYEKKVLETVVKYVCILFDTSDYELMSASRYRNIADGRAICIAVLTSFTKLTERKIAARFNRDHSTANASVKKVITLRDTNTDFRAKLKVILDYINVECSTTYTIENIVERKNIVPSDKVLFNLTNDYDRKVLQLLNDYNDNFTLILVKKLRKINDQIEARLNFIYNNPQNT